MVLCAETLQRVSFKEPIIAAPMNDVLDQVALVRALTQPSKSNFVKLVGWEFEYYLMKVLKSTGKGLY